MAKKSAEAISAQEAAERINAHFKRILEDPNINCNMKSERVNNDPNDPRPRLFLFSPFAYARGKTVHICYVSFQGWSKLTYAEAQAYADWLDQNNLGSHHTMELRATNATGHTT